jgi:urease accessory protein
VLEYLPDPLILFRGARLTNRLSVHADPSAVVLWWDALIPHDPVGRGGHFEWLASETSVYETSGRLLARDRFRLQGAALSAALPGVTGSWKCQGAFFAVQRRLRQADLVSALRAALPDAGTAYCGAAALPSGCGAWVRVLAKDAVALRGALSAAWYAARRLLFGAEPVPRRK